MSKPADDPLEKSSNAMQEQVRKGGYRQNADGSYETNEGRVVLESPHEEGRRAIYAKSAETRKWYGWKGERDQGTLAMAKELAKDTELDIDWGIYAPEAEEPVMFHGRAKGGCYDGLMLAHPEETMLVAIDTTSKRPLIGQVGPSRQNPYIRWFAYLWQADSKTWKWDDSPGRSGP